MISPFFEKDALNALNGVRSNDVGPSESLDFNQVEGLEMSRQCILELGRASAKRRLRILGGVWRAVGRVRKSRPTARRTL